MRHFFQQMLDGSEVWALFIPAFFAVRQQQKIPYLKPVRIYVWIAVVLNTLIVLISKRNQWFGLPENPEPAWLGSNNFLYNLHSIARFMLFSWFFILLQQPLLGRVKKILPLLFVAGVLVNFIFFENFFYYWNFSGRLISIEATLLLFYCLLYYLYMLRDEESNIRRSPSFWVVTGLSIYVVVNIPIFLFYIALLKQFEDFTIDIWDVHNFSFILFCVFLAKAFYESKQ